MSPIPLRLPPWLPILILCGATIFTGLGSISLFEPDEPRFAAATRTMLDSGDYLTPYLNGRPRFEKPILFYWMQLVPFAVLGSTETAARLPAAICGLLAVLLLYLLGRRLTSERAALIAALVLATLFRFVIYCRQGLTDVPVLLFELAAIWGFWRALEEPDRSRRFSMIAWACVGLAAVTKGPVAVIPVLVWVSYLAVTRNLRSGARRMHIPTGALVAALIAAPWYLYMVALHGRVYVESGLEYELMQRYADPAFTGTRRGIFYFMGVWPGDAAPWTVFFVAALGWFAVRWRALDERERRAVKLSLVWFASVLALFSTSNYKLPHYLLPLYPALALVVGLFADKAAQSGAVGGAGRWWRGALLVTATLMAVVALFVGVFLSAAFGVALTGLAMLLPLLLAGGAIAAVVLELRSARLASISAFVVCLGASYGFLGAYVAPRHLQSMQPIRDLGLAVAAEAKVGDRLAQYGSYGGPGLMFYANHIVELLPTPDATAQFLAGTGRRFCVLSASDFQALQSRAHSSLYVLMKRDVLNVRFERVLEGGAADPARALLLVSNQPNRAPE